MERMRRSIRPGTGGGGTLYPGGYGHSEHSRMDGDTFVVETVHFHKGYEIAVTERLRLTDDSKGTRYTVEAKGPKGDPIVNEMAFDIE